MKNILFKTMALLFIFLFAGTSAVFAGSFTTVKNQSVNSYANAKWQYKMLKSNKNKYKDKEKGSKHKNQGGKKSKDVQIKQLILNKASITLSQGSWVRLTAKVVPDKAQHRKVVWTTKDSKVAKVNPSGKITGVGPGTTVITAICLNGSIQATCTVTVTGKTAPVPNTDTDNDLEITTITINKTTDYIVIKDGSTKSLTVTTQPGNTNESLHWSSSNTSVAIVDQRGKVTAIDEGTAIISVKTSDSNKSDSCKVRVINESDWVSVRRVQINLVNTIIPVGSKENLKYRLEPASVSDQEVKWSSSNPSVAYVDIYGTVHGKKQGTAEITATSADGRRRDTCLVTVTSAIQLPSNGILLNKISSTLEVGSKDFPSVTVYPSGTSSTLTWSSSDTSIAIVNRSGEVTGVKEGTVIITVKTVDNKYASYVLLVT